MLSRGPSLRRLAGLVPALALIVAGCSAEDDPCASLSCPDGFACVVGAGGAVCAPPVDPCGVAGVCSADETCVVAVDGRARCLQPDRCRTVDCPVGKGCDKATGECTIDKAPCEGVRCPQGQSCDVATGECVVPVDLCSGVCCNSDQVCDPATGKCVVDQCDILSVACACGPAQVCEPVTGACLSAPGPCEDCEANQYCDEARGACVTIENGPAAAGKVGAACANTSQCAGAGADAFCIQDKGLFGDMPQGMCSASCDMVGCPSGSGCVDVGLQVCLDLCLSRNDCRPGYDCLSITSNDPRTFCFPQGSGGSQCEGPECGILGSDCEEDNDCVKGARCSSLVGGYCIKNNCRATDCDEPSEYCLCLGTGDCAGSTIGLGKCNLGAQDCRPGYACYPVSSTNFGAGDSGYCYPRSCEVDSDCRVEGDECSVALCEQSRGLCVDPCTRDEQCIGGDACDVSSGRCYTPCNSPTDMCGPDAFCNLGEGRCQRRCVGDATCGAENFCDLGSGQCKPRCTGDAQCAADQFCDASGRCRAQCDTDTDCSSSEMCQAGRCEQRCTGVSGCGFGQFCDLTSGRCQRDLRGALVGNACGTDGQCGAYNAKCLTGAAWPGGYCSAPGCSETEPCGDGAVCINDGSEARCLKKCGAGVAGGCRPGYACSEVGGQEVCLVEPAP